MIFCTDSAYIRCTENLIRKILLMQSPVWNKPSIHLIYPQLHTLYKPYLPFIGLIYSLQNIQHFTEHPHKYYLLFTGHVQNLLTVFMA